MKKFEYKIEELCRTNEETCSLLNKLGEQGWELVSIDKRSGIFAYFKRCVKAPTFMPPQ